MVRFIWVAHSMIWFPPKREIDRTIAQYSQESHRKALRGIVELAMQCDAPDELGLKEVAGRLDIGVQNLTVALSQIRQKRLLPASPPIAVRIFPQKGYPQIFWFDGKFPETDDLVRSFAESAATNYKDEDANAIWQILCTYAALREDPVLPSSLRVTLIDHFVNALKTHPGIRVQFRTQHHEEIISLLQIGFPESPVHLGGLISLDPIHIFTVPHYAKLLHGIRASERNVVVSEAILTAVPAKDCPLQNVALGISKRKQDGMTKLQEAVSILRVGINLLEEDGNKEKCSRCPVHCHKSILFIEHYRTTGAAQRKLVWHQPSESHLEEARKSFADGARYFNDHVPKRVQADFYFSYGYLEFEAALREHSGVNVTQTLRRRLECAEEKLKEATKGDDVWAAPRLRIGIIKCILNNAQAGQYFADAATFAQREDHADAVLTGTLAKLCHLSMDSRTGRDDSMDLLTQMETTFRSVLLSRGPRECHAFDAEIAYRWIQGILREKSPLHCGFELMIQAGTWGDYDSLEEQITHLDAWFGTNACGKSWHSKDKQ